MSSPERAEAECVYRDGRLWIYAITEQREAEALSVITRVLREYGTPYPRVTAERVVAALKEKEKLDG